MKKCEVCGKSHRRKSLWCSNLCLMKHRYDIEKMDWKEILMEYVKKERK
jgi:hypothetical protein